MRSLGHRRKQDPCTKGEVNFGEEQGFLFFQGKAKEVSTEVINKCLEVEKREATKDDIFLTHLLCFCFLCAV